LSESHFEAMGLVIVMKKVARNVSFEPLCLQSEEALKGASFFKKLIFVFSSM